MKKLFSQTFFFWALLFIGSGTLFAQTSKSRTLSGIIKDQKTGEALPFAAIGIKGTYISATTNAEGYFSLTEISTDTGTLLAQYSGYSATEISFTSESFKSNLVIELPEMEYKSKEITVFGERESAQLNSKTTISTLRMEPKKLEDLPSLGEKDMMRTFQLMPGISSSNESSSGLYVRGGTPDQNLVVFDGFTIYHVDHLYGFFSAFNANALKDVQIYKGGFESRFGGRLSSVTEITGKDGNQNQFNIGGDINLLSANVFLEIPIKKKFTSVIAGRMSYPGYIYNTIFGMFNSNNNSGTTTSKPGESGRSTANATANSYFYDVNGKFTFRPTDNDAISLSIYHGSDYLNNSTSAKDVGLSNGSSLSNSTTDLTTYGNIGVSLKASRKWSDKFFSTTLVSYSNYYSRRNNSQSKTVTDTAGVSNTNSTGIFEYNNLKDYSFKLDYQWDIRNWNQLQFGGFGTQYQIDYTFAQNDSITIIDKTGSAFLGGFYVQDKMSFFKNKLQILPGIRFSYFTNTKKPYFEPRASVIWNATPNLTFKASVGRFYQFANRVMREDILSGSRDFWILSDGSSVPVSSAMHYIFGAQYEFKGWLFSAEGYYKTLRNISEYSLRVNTSPLSVNYSENFLVGNGYARGIEFLVQRTKGNLNGWVSYTLGQARNHFEAYSDTYFPASQDVTHEFKVVVMYKLKRFNFSVSWVYATGRPYTAPSGAYDVQLLDGSSQTFYSVTDKNGQRLPDYHRLDFSANYRIFVGKKGKEKHEIGYVGVSLFNAYNRSNIWYKQYSITNNEIVETNVRYLGITPNVTLSFKLH